MIFKGKHRKTASFRQLLNYLLEDKGRGLHPTARIITHNLKGGSIDEWTKQLEANEYMGQPLRKNRIRVLHEIISFHTRDKEQISMEVLEDLAQEYIGIRGESGMYVIIPHMSDEHVHMHVCGSPWEQFGGKSLRLSKSDLMALKLELERVQKERYPELLYSIGRHGGGIDKERVL